MVCEKRRGFDAILLLTKNKKHRDVVTGGKEKCVLRSLSFHTEDSPKVW